MLTISSTKQHHQQQQQHIVKQCVLPPPHLNEFMYDAKRTVEENSMAEPSIFFCVDPIWLSMSACGRPNAKIRNK